ncbi:hypothetical protein FO519_007518 [Halicephalobus sp. NKZ332]|nr:hypothetical protein FO519_007518 [Halicephalobus sp. NKZ332]
MSYGYGGYGGYNSNFGGGYRQNNYPSNFGSGGYGGYGGSSFTGETNWCPSGEGYPAYCPMGGADYTYNHCCSTFLWFGPGCCYLALSVWNIILIVISIILLLGLLVGLIRCWPSMYPNRSRNVQRRAPVQTYNQQMYPDARPGVVLYEKEPFRHY